jgi:hypothetical protein
VPAGVGRPATQSVLTHAATVQDESHNHGPNPFYAHDARGAVSTVAQTLSTGQFTTSYGYDARGELASVTVRRSLPRVVGDRVQTDGSGAVVWRGSEVRSYPAAPLPSVWTKGAAEGPARGFAASATRCASRKLMSGVTYAASKMPRTTATEINTRRQLRLRRASRAGSEASTSASRSRLSRTYTCGFYNCINWVHSVFDEAP